MDLPGPEQQQLRLRAAEMNLEQLREAFVELLLESDEWTKRGQDSQAELSGLRANVFYDAIKAQSALPILAPLLNSGVPVLEYRAAASLAAVEPTGAFRESAIAKLEQLSDAALGTISGGAFVSLGRIRFGTPFPTQQQVDEYKASHG